MAMEVLENVADETKRRELEEALSRAEKVDQSGAKWLAEKWKI